MIRLKDYKQISIEAGCFDLIVNLLNQLGEKAQTIWKIIVLNPKTRDAYRLVPSYTKYNFLEYYAKI